MDNIAHYFDNKYILIFSISTILLIMNLFTNKVVFYFLHIFFDKTKTNVDLLVLEALKKPITSLYFLLILYFVQNIFEIQELSIILKTLFAILIFWTLHRLIEPFKEFIYELSDKFDKNISEGITNFIIKTLKFFNFFFAFAVVLQTWGFNVTGFLASLGIGGLAFALAAKDTAANLFGSLVIFGDKPFQIGDWIVTDKVEGVVEDIGIRSTKIRRFDQALVNVPNANIANSSIVNYTKMGKRRIKMNIGLTYSTTSEQMQSIVTEIREMLNFHEDIHKDTIFIYFTDFNDSNLGIFCYFFTNTTNWGEFMRIKEDINLKIISIVQKNRASFAFPSQSIYIENSEKA